MAPARRHTISGERLRRAGDDAGRLASSPARARGVLAKLTSYDDGMVTCTYKGPASDDEQLNWSTPVLFSWTFRDVAGELVETVRAGRALGKRTRPMPRALRPPHAAACLPHLITATRVLPCMKHHHRAVCRAVALPRLSTGVSLTTARLDGRGGNIAEYILCARVADRQWLAHPLSSCPSLSTLKKMNVPATAQLRPYDGRAADLVVAAATFAAEKETAVVQHRPMDLDIAQQHLDTSPFSWTKRTKVFFVLWTSWGEDGGEHEDHMTVASLQKLAKVLRAS